MDEAAATSSTSRQVDNAVASINLTVPPRDQHQLRSAVQALGRPHVWSLYGLEREQVVRLEHTGEFKGFREAVHRVAADGLSPERAADELIARVKQILGE